MALPKVSCGSVAEHLWSAPRIATSGLVQRHSGFEWICKHNRLRPEPIRFVRLESEHAQSDGKSVNRRLPVLDQARGTQRSNDWARARFTHFRLLPVTFLFHHTKFPRSTSYTRAISSSVLRPIILPLQTFLVLLLGQQAFLSGNLPPERPTTTTTAIKT